MQIKIPISPDSIRTIKNLLPELSRSGVDIKSSGNSLILDGPDNGSLGEVASAIRAFDKAA
jgi:ribosomal protein L6P/L9E